MHQMRCGNSKHFFLAQEDHRNGRFKPPSESGPEAVPPKSDERLYNQKIRSTFVTLLGLNVRSAWTRNNEREFQHTTRNSQGG